MSQEILDQLPPLTPESAETVAEETTDETVVETAEESAAEETPKMPDWSPPVQKLQEKFATFQRHILEALTELKSARAAPQQEAARDELNDLLEEAKKFDDLMPGYSAHTGKILGKLREALALKGELPALREAVQNREDVSAYMADKPAGFKEAYATAQAELIEEAKASGDNVTQRELRLALGVWAKNWLKENKTAPKPRPGAGGRSVIPAPAARRTGKVPDQLDMESNGYVPDGKGGFRSGNKLGR
jgi:hypothetical protein